MECRARTTERAATTVALLALLALWLLVPAPARAARAGSLVSFGEDEYGQLGLGTHSTAGADTPQRITVFRHEEKVHTETGSEVVLAEDGYAQAPFLAAAAGSDFSLAANAEGELDAFGGDQHGQLGFEPLAVPVDSPTLVGLALPPEAGQITQVAAGFEDGFAVTSTGLLLGWGRDGDGQAGTATTCESKTEEEGVAPATIAVPSHEPLAQVAAGRSFTLALTRSGRVYGFGSNDFGELGRKKGFGVVCEEASATPAEVEFPTAEDDEPIAQVAAGKEFGLAVTRGGRLYAFGESESGDTGRTGSGSSDEPTEIHLGEPVERVAAGNDSTLILTRAGRVYSLGSNTMGQLGREQNFGVAAANSTPEPVALAAGTAPVVQIAAGESSSLVVTDSGQLFTFGENQFGQLGVATKYGSATGEWKPQQVALPEGLKAEYPATGPTANQSLLIAGEPAVETTALGKGRAGSPYAASLSAIGGRPPYTWRASGLPPGLGLNAASGLVSGTPSSPGTYSFHVTATDAFGILAEGTVRLTVTEPLAAISDLRFAAARGASAARVTFRVAAPASVRIDICAVRGRRCRAVGSLSLRSARAEHVTRLLRDGTRLEDGRRLKPGRYELYIVATNDAGRVTSRRLDFTIARPHRAA